MAGSSVSFAGLIGFLGLIVPRGARLVVGDEIKKLFPLNEKYPTAKRSEAKIREF